jgi:hypothetical protein
VGGRDLWGGSHGCSSVEATMGGGRLPKVKRSLKSFGGLERVGDMSASYVYADPQSGMGVSELSPSPSLGQPRVSTDRGDDAHHPLNMICRHSRVLVLEWAVITVP